jgi:hypothetical protein
MKANAGKTSTSEVSSSAGQNLRIELVRMIIPLLWFIFAAVAFICLFPLAQTAIKQGNIEKIKVGVIEVDLALAHVPVRLSANSVEIAKEAVPISPTERKRISARFEQMSGKTKGATILWVDDKHPYQNVLERRVFLAAEISVDLARSTSEAMEWLTRSNYNVVITDADRSASKDPPAPCYQGTPEPAHAGCALLRKVGGCFKLGGTDNECVLMRARPGAKMPIMIVYAGNYRPELGTPPYAAGMTNRSDELFELVLNALEHRETNP